MKAIFVFAALLVCALAQKKFYPAELPCSFAASFKTDDGRSANFSVIGDMMKIVGDIKGGKPDLYLYRGDIKDQSGNMLYVKVEDFDESQHTASSCNAQYLAESQFESEMESELEIITGPFYYYNVIDDPDTCTGCKKYCEKNEDCATADDDYFVADADNRLVVVFTDDKLTVTYGPTPDFDEFALDNSACSNKYEAPTANPCPMEYTPAPLPCGFSVFFKADGMSASYYGLGERINIFDFRGEENEFFINRGDIKDDSGNMMHAKIMNIDETHHSGDGCNIQYLYEENFDHDIKEQLAYVTGPFDYYSVIDDPDTCTGCKKYCTIPGDCSAMDDNYFVVDANDRLVVVFDGIKMNVTYGPAPSVGFFALNNTACSERFAAPEENPCPLPPASSSSVHTNSTTSTPVSSASRVYLNMIIGVFFACAVLVMSL